MPQLLISDTNILIDMDEGGLLEAMFQLPFDFATPDILFAEELEDQHANLPGLGLIIKEVAPESMMYAAKLAARYARASRNDCLALALAKQEQCPLLTGDKALKLAAEKESTIAMGTIWLVGQMVKKRRINAEQARFAYRLMQHNGRRLPWSEAEKELVAIERNLA